MVRKMKAFVLVMALAAPLAAWAFAVTVQCPFDGTQMNWTGQSKFEWGKQVLEYKCGGGHTVWQVAN